jgi:hypothetical protein
MKRSALFMVSSDPLKTNRPAEAIRIAAGILPWKKIKVQIYFHHPFARALREHPEDLKGLDHILRFYPILDQEPHTTFGPQDSGPEFELDGQYLHLTPMPPPKLAQLQNSSTWLLHF